MMLVHPLLLLVLLTPTSSSVSNDVNLCMTSATSDSVKVSCARLGLTSVPTSLPDNVTWLDLSVNNIRKVTGDDLSGLSHLVYLDLSHNAISSIGTETFEGVSRLQVLDLSNNNITLTDEGVVHPPHTTTRNFISREAGGHPATTTATTRRTSSPPPSPPPSTTTTACPFRPLGNLRSLSLSNNFISALTPSCFNGLSSLISLSLSGNFLGTIRNETFRGLSTLEQLDLSHNRLTSLQSGSLYGMRKLRTLRLNSNQLDYTNSSLPPGLYRPVRSTMTSLYLQDNMGYDVYPDDAFRDLPDLTLLSVDTFYNLEFGQGFSYLKKLRSLEVSEGCQTRIMTNSTFESFATVPLRALTMVCGYLRSVERCTWCPLRHLTSLSMAGASSSNLTLLLDSLYGLQGHNMSLIDFRSVDREGVTILNAHNMKYIHNICVRKLMLNGNGITAIHHGGFARRNSRFSECLQHIDLSYNFIRVIVWSEIYKFIIWTENLVRLDVQMQKSLDMQLALYNFGRRKNPQVISTLGMFTLSIPQHFRWANFSGSSALLGSLPSTVNLSNAHGWRVLDLSYVRLVGCESRILGVENLEMFNISGNDCYRFSPYYFDAFPNLKTLSMQKTNFNASFFSTHGPRLFRNLTRLQFLDLSFNALQSLPSDLFYAQSELKELLLLGNKLRSVDVDLSRTNLSFLDLSDNAITQLDPGERAAMETLNAQHGRGLRLHLQGNPLACTCDTLPFVHWLITTRVDLDLGGDYPCVTDNGRLSSVRNIGDHWDFTWRRCVGLTVLWWSVAMMMLLLSLTGAVWAVSANVTRLRFLLTVFKRIKLPQRHHFHKDAYLAYCDADWRLACLQLKRVLQDQRGVQLLIKDLPVDEAGTQFYLSPGDDVAEKMLQHMDMCWKVVLVLTAALTRDHTAGFMTRAALQTMTDTMPERVVLLCVGLRHVPPIASLHALLETVPERHIFFLPLNAGDNHPVWDHLATAILQ